MRSIYGLERKEKKALMYMVGEGEMYVTSSKVTNQLTGVIAFEIIIIIKKRYCGRVETPGKMPPLS